MAEVIGTFEPYPLTEKDKLNFINTGIRLDGDLHMPVRTWPGTLDAPMAFFYYMKNKTFFYFSIIFSVKKCTHNVYHTEEENEL